MGKPTTQERLSVPRVIRIMQKCIDNKIPDSFINKLHFSDLLLLVMIIDISNVRQALSLYKKQQNKMRNIEVRDISQNDAIKFLKGG